ncbi:MAG: KOW domain-containing RNA-binding protein [Eubacteriales bacterium]|nr:KOW domain-containing RNA-binding protein [Eubacteriales bacterium]
MNEPVIGTVCTSRAGRDKGRAFVILGICDENHVLLCDGETRRVERPKKKKLMHLHIEPCHADEIGKRVTEGASLLDADVRKALNRLGYNVNKGN